MSSQHPPIDCRDFKRILKKLGFEPGNQVGSHQHWKKVENGRLYKVTVDCPKSPFTGRLLDLMAAQAGVSKKRIYEVLRSL